MPLGDERCVIFFSKFREVLKCMAYDVRMLLGCVVRDCSNN